jgi:hypothetical protein
MTAGSRQFVHDDPGPVQRADVVQSNKSHPKPSRGDERRVRAARSESMVNFIGAPAWTHVKRPCVAAGPFASWVGRRGGRTLGEDILLIDTRFVPAKRWQAGVSLPRCADQSRHRKRDQQQHPCRRLGHLIDLDLGLRTASRHRLHGMRFGIRTVLHSCLLGGSSVSVWGKKASTHNANTADDRTMMRTTEPNVAGNVPRVRVDLTGGRNRRVNVFPRRSGATKLALILVALRATLVLREVVLRV